MKNNCLTFFAALLVCFHLLTSCRSRSNTNENQKQIEIQEEREIDESPNFENLVQEKLTGGKHSGSTLLVFDSNGDGKNDEFSIDLSSYEFTDFSLVILDMKNQLVFKSNNPQENWNGKKVDGDVCPAGTYIYYLTGKTVSGKTISKYSTLRIQY